MNGKTYDQFMREFFDHYNEKDYAGALDLLNREGDQFPEMHAVVIYNRACMLGVQNHVEEALTALREAEDRGYWFDEASLRQDTDLVALQGHPEFERLMGEFKIRQAVAQAHTGPERIVIEPPAGTPTPYPVLFALHGNMNNASRSRPYWEAAANAGWLTVVVQSSQVGLSDGTFNWNDEAGSVSQIEQHRTELMQTYPIDPQRVVIGGFSAGGRIASLIGLMQPFPVRGIIAVAAYLTGKLDEWTPKIAAAGEHGLRAYLITGEADPGIEDVKRFADLLKAQHVACELKIYPEMGHIFPPDFDMALVEALQFIMA